MGNNQTNQRTGDVLVNSFMLKVVTVIDAFLFVGYIQDYYNGAAITLRYTIIIEMLLLLSLIADFVTYKKFPTKFKHVSAIGYMVVYGLAVLGAASDLLFAIAFPIFVIFILYYDLKLTTILAAFGSVINIVDVLFQVLVLKATHAGNAISVTGILLQLADMIIFLLVLVQVTKISNANNAEKLGKIQGITDHLTGSIVEINGRLIDLNQSSATMKSAMSDVNSGVSDTARAVSDQLMQTGNIQEQLEQVQSATGQMASNLDETLHHVDTGNQSVQELVSNSEAFGRISTEVCEKLKILQNNMSEMNKITSLINSIAFQTNIMALNANVEAARAGEAGRGFAVVASEISNMSDKTKEATDSIDELISKVSSSLTELVTSIDDMTGLVEKEIDQTKDASEAFETIQTNTISVKEKTDLLLDRIENLTNANKQIVQSVETISASTQEVMALTSQALDIETSNADSINEVSQMVSDLAE